MEDVKEIVRKFLLDSVVMTGDLEIADDTSFMEDHVLDSTGFIELVSFIEERFGVTVEDEEMLPENFDCLVDIDAYLARKRAGCAVA
jgi:acyl carrier protein